jgi:hypothetical protein
VGYNEYTTDDGDDPLEHDELHEHPLHPRFEACNIRIALTMT